MNLSASAGPAQIEEDPWLALPDSLHARGAGPAELLYNGWVESGLAEEGYPVWLTFWSGGGLPQEELRVGAGALRPAVADDFLQEARATGLPSVRRFNLADAHYLAMVPLAGGAVVTPLREIRLSSRLGPLFTPAGGAEPDPLTLVPVWPGDPVNLTERVEWVRQEGGWHGELGRTYPDARFHAHYRVELSFPLPCCWSPAAACCSRATSRCSRCCGHWDTHSGIKEVLPGRSGVGCSRPFGPG